jgi:hypothetical protein
VFKVSKDSQGVRPLLLCYGRPDDLQGRVFLMKILKVEKWRQAA